MVAFLDVPNKAALILILGHFKYSWQHTSLLVMDSYQLFYEPAKSLFHLFCFTGYLFGITLYTYTHTHMSTHTHTISEQYRQLLCPFQVILR